MPVYARTGDTLTREPHPRSIDAFCARNGISRGTFYNLVKVGRAPAVLKLGSRTTITEEAEADWKRCLTAPLAPRAA